MTVEMSDDRILKEVRDRLEKGKPPFMVIIERHRDSSMEELLASLPEGATNNTDEYVFFRGDKETILALEDNPRIFHVWLDAPISPFGLGLDPDHINHVIDRHLTELTQIQGVISVGHSGDDIIIGVEELTKKLQRKLPAKLEGYQVKIEEIGSYATEHLER